MKRTTILCIYCAIKSYICTLNWIFFLKRASTETCIGRWKFTIFLIFEVVQTLSGCMNICWINGIIWSRTFSLKESIGSTEGHWFPNPYLGERFQVPKVAFSRPHVRGECCKQGTLLSLRHMLGPSRVLLWIPTFRSSSVWEKKYFRVKVDHHVQGGDAGETAGVQDAFSWGRRCLRGSQVEFKW